MSGLTITSINALVESYQGQTAEALAELFHAKRQTMLESITAAAAIIRVYESKGWDLAPLKIGPRELATLQRIGAGALLPELAASTLTATAVSRVSRLPLTVQKQVVADSEFEVVTGQGDGVDVRTIRPSEMTPTQVNQVFGYERVRTPAEQRTHIDEARTRMMAAKPTGPGPVVFDEKKRCIYVTGTRVQLTAKDLAQYAARLAG